MALKIFATGKSHTHIRIMTDNSTAVSVINHMGTSHSHSCNSMAKKIWEWCIEKNIWLSVAMLIGSSLAESSELEAISSLEVELTRAAILKRPSDFRLQSADHVARWKHTATGSPTQQCTHDTH